MRTVIVKINVVCKKMGVKVVYYGDNISTINCKLEIKLGKRY